MGVPNLRAVLEKSLECRVGHLFVFFWLGSWDRRQKKFICQSPNDERSNSIHRERSDHCHLCKNFYWCMLIARTSYRKRYKKRSSDPTWTSAQTLNEWPTKHPTMRRTSNTTRVRFDWRKVFSYGVGKVFVCVKHTSLVAHEIECDPLPRWVHIKKFWSGEHTIAFAIIHHASSVSMSTTKWPQVKKFLSKLVRVQRVKFECQESAIVTRWRVEWGWLKFYNAVKFPKTFQFDRTRFPRDNLRFWWKNHEFLACIEIF